MSKKSKLDLRIEEDYEVNKLIVKRYSYFVKNEYVSKFFEKHYKDNLTIKEITSIYEFEISYFYRIHKNIQALFYREYKSRL